MSTLGQKQPRNILSGERLVSGLCRLLRIKFSGRHNLNVRFHKKRPLKRLVSCAVHRLLSANSSHSIHSENGLATAEKGRKLKGPELVRPRDSDIGSSSCSFHHFVMKAARGVPAFVDFAYL